MGGSAGLIPDIGSEIRRFPPSAPGSRPIHVGLVYPNAYSVAIASLGYQTVHLIAACTPGVVTHRVVLSRADGHEYPVRTLEEGLTIGSLTALLFSCSFELDYLHMVRILHAAGIQPIRRKRGKTPLVVAGGAAVTANPEPLAPFCDAIVVGEAEDVLPALLRELVTEGDVLSGPGFTLARDRLYEAWDRLEGVYVPALWEDEEGRFVERDRKVCQAAVRDINANLSYTPVVSEAGAYGAKNLVEISRGCSTRCRFCLISHISPANRQRHLASVLENVQRFAPHEATVGLVSSAVSDHSEVIPIINELSSRGYEVSVSSLKLGSTSRELLLALAGAGARSVTFAPEHGSGRIRILLGKDVSYEEVRDRVNWAFEAGVKSIKLYFLTGFEEESEDDIRATPDFVVSLASDVDLAGRAQGFRFVVGLAAFVPKASTPFQRRPMLSESELKSRLRKMQKPLSGHPRIELEIESPRASILQGILSRGDRGLERHLLAVAESRGPILKSWEDAKRSEGEWPEKLMTTPVSPKHRLPWHFIRRAGRDAGGALCRESQ